MVIDIGANIGEFSLNFTSVPQIEVYAFEPDVQAMKALRLNDVENKINKFELVAADKNGTIDFFMSSFHADSSIIAPTDFTHVISRKAVRLADWIVETVRHDKRLFIKIDAEGAEPEVLRGLMGINPQRIAYISVDVGPERSNERTEEEVRQILGTFDFQEIELLSPNILVGSNIGLTDS